MRIDSHNPMALPIGDNRHEPLKIIHVPRTGAMRGYEHHKREHEIMLGHELQRKQLEKTAKRLKIKLPKALKRNG